MYRIEWCRDWHTSGSTYGAFHIIAKNGAVVAKCKTEEFARKIIRGLLLCSEEKKRLENFLI